MSRRSRITPPPLFKENNPRLRGRSKTLSAHVATKELEAFLYPPHKRFVRGFSHTDLTHSLFGRACLTEADFTEAVNYDIDVRDNEVGKCKFSRYEAVRLLYGYDIEVIE